VPKEQLADTALPAPVKKLLEGLAPELLRGVFHLRA